MGALDLSALDEELVEIKEVSDGKVLRAPLDMFVPDHTQLNRERDTEADDRDRADIKLRGVLQPIVVGTRLPDGRLPIRYGCRRWRLSGEAGLTDAPYIFEIDGTVSDDYAQYAENARRKGPSPMDRAELIVKRKALGDKNAYIARQIGIDPAEITHHIVLIEGPDYIRALYSENKCRTPKYLYELANLAKDFPEQIKEFCLNSIDFSRNTIDNVAASLKNKNLGITKEMPEHKDGKTNESTDYASSNNNEANADETVAWPFSASNNTNSDDDDKNNSDNHVSTSHIPSHNPENEKNTTTSYNADPSKMKKPLLLGTYHNSDVMVLLYKRPTTPGLVFVKHENGTGEEEVEFDKIKNLTLTESKL